MKRIVAQLFILILISSSVTGQFTETVLNEPPGQNWKIIKTEHFSLVFPARLTDQAQILARRAEEIFGELIRTSVRVPKRLTLLLSNQGVDDNGYFRLAPRMSEWYHRPTFLHTTGVVDWYDLLAMHEGRHVVQFEEMDEGFTKIAGVLFGDLGRAAASLRSIPLWLIEGDAVVAETELSEGGRGRSPAFDMDIRALLLSGIRYGYHKAYLGSYSDWYPNNYHLGFLLAAFARREYGPRTVQEIFRWTVRRADLLFPFPRAVKLTTGMNVTEYYEKVMDELQDFWTAQQSKIDTTDFHKINLEERAVWTNYMSPRYDADGNIYVQKTGLDQPPNLVRLSRTGGETTLAQIAPLGGMYNRLSVSKGLVCWNEAVPDLRWGKRVFADIVVFDLVKGKRKRITRQGKYFDPMLSPDGKIVAAVEYTADRKCTLVLLDSGTGEELYRFSNVQNDLYMNPTWSRDQKNIAVLRQNHEGRALSLLSPGSDRLEDVIPLSHENICFPVLFGDYILYNSPYSGIDNIYAVRISDRRRFQVTSSRFGAFFPEISPDGASLLYNDYSIQGYDVAERPFNPLEWTKIEDVERLALPFYDPPVYSSPDTKAPVEEKISQPSFEVRDYRPWSRLLNIHSWGILPTASDVGFYVFSNNVLNTTSLVGRMVYNLNEKKTGFGLSGIYAGFFPLLNFDIYYGGRSAVYRNEDDQNVTSSWEEKSAGFGLQIPLNFSRGTHRMRLSLSSHVSLTSVEGKTIAAEDENNNGLFVHMGYELQLFRAKKASFRDFLPRWGQSLILQYRNTPWKGDYRGNIASAILGFYFPGIAQHHSFFLETGFEIQNPVNYRFPSRMLFARGYDYSYHETLSKISMNYAFPLAYPDWALDGILYLKRLRGNLFFDYGVGRDSGVTSLFRSCGFELFVDFHALDIPVELELGFRLSYRWRERSFRAEIVLFDFDLGY